MQIIREDLNPCTVKLSITCSQAQVKEGFDKAFKQIAKKVRVPGFRPGMAPKAVLEPMIDPREVAEEAAEQIIRKTLKLAIEEQQLKPDQSQPPAVDLTKLERENDACEYTVKVPLPPIIELGAYKGLPLEKPAIEVSEEDVSYQIDEMRRRKSTKEAVTDRGVQEGDVAMVNLKVEGDEGDGRNFMTVAGQTFPQLDEALMGMTVEEFKQIELTFPDKFQEKDWAGKTLKARLLLNSISTVKLPEIEDFAKSLQLEGSDDLNQKMREAILRAKTQMVQEMLVEQAYEKLMERSKIEVSDNAWENLANRRLSDIQQDLQRQGKTLAKYAEENGMTGEQLVENQKAEAKKHIQRALIIREIFSKEEMKLDNVALNQELVLMAEEFEATPEDLLAMLQKNKALDEVHFRAVSRKVAEFLVESAETQEVASASA